MYCYGAWQVDVPATVVLFQSPLSVHVMYVFMLQQMLSFFDSCAQK